jgi:hypothetical protein
METKSGSFLADWTVNFIKNKDIIAKKIQNIENGKNGFDLHVKYRDREQYFIIAPSISNIDSIIQKIDNNAHYTIVTLNSKENFDSMLKSWHNLVSFKFLSIIFVNPFSQLDKKWVIFPHTHHKICDESSLENGLKSMFGMVEPIGEEQLLVKITG